MGGNNMGGSAAQTSQSYEGSLAVEQRKVLSARQKDWEQHFKPIILQGIKEASDGTTEKANMAQQTYGINQNYAQSKQSFAQAMAQRGLGGTGVEAQGLSSLQNTRALNLANAYYSAQQQAKNEKMNFLQLGLQTVPSTTTTATTLSKTGNESMWHKYW